jgi:hypothetical protein
MIYEFKCRATGTVVMTKPAAEWLLRVIGKEPGPTGIITVAQMPAAIDAIRTAVEEEKRAIREARQESSGAPPAGAGDLGQGEDASAVVTLAQRAWPFVEMLEAAHKAERDITWGV